MEEKEPSAVSIHIARYSSFLIAGLLLFAVIAKWLYPLPQPWYLEKIALYIEIIIVILLPIFFRRVQTWVLTLMVFSLWTGYSFFWFINREPCGCFGALGEYSAGISLGLDCLMLVLSCINIIGLGGKTRTLLLSILCGGVLTIIGFWIGAFAFHLTKTSSNPILPIPAQASGIESNEGFAESHRKEP